MDSSNTEAISFGPSGDNVASGFDDIPPHCDLDMIDLFGFPIDPTAPENYIFAHPTFTSATLSESAMPDASETSFGQQRVSPQYQRTVAHVINPRELNENSTNDSVFAWSDHVLQDSSCAPPQREPNSISNLGNGENVAGLADADPAPPPTPPSPKNRRQRRSAEEWQEMGPIIEKLRMKEGKCLAEIRQILADNHNFSASEKAYKDHFRIWGLRVNLNQRKAHQMLQIERQRKVEEEKETSFRYKGVEVSKVKLDRYRKGAPPADSIKSTTSAFSDLSFYTPQNSCSQKQDTSIQEQSKSVQNPIDIASANNQRNGDGNLRVDNTEKRTIFSTLDERIKAIHDSTIFHGDQSTYSVLEALETFRDICANLEPSYVMHVFLSGNMVYDLREYSSSLGEDFSDCKLYAVLEILRFQATALIRIEKLASAETVLDQILWLAREPWRTDPFKWFEIWLGSVWQLLAMYSRQRRYWLMEKLLASTISEGKALLGNDKTVELQELQGLLLIIRMCDIDCRDFKFRGLLVHHTDQQEMRVLLKKIPFSASIERFHLGVLDYLRKTYTMERQLDELEPILDRLKRLLGNSLELRSWDLFKSYVCIGLIQSYCYLDRFVDAERCLDFFYDMICRRHNPGCFVANIRELARSTDEAFWPSSGDLEYPRLPWPSDYYTSSTAGEVLPWRRDYWKYPIGREVLVKLKEFEASEPVSDYACLQGFRQFCLKAKGHIVMPWEVERDV